MGWGLMWLLVADARGKRKGGEKAFSTNRFHCQRWIIALLHTHFLTFYCWHWMANFPFAECLKISQNCEILQILQKWDFLSDFPTPWLLLYAMKTLVFSEKREKVVTSRGWWPSSPWQLRSHFLLRKKVFYDWHPYPPSLPNWEAQRVRGSKRASEEGMTLSYLCRRELSYILTDVSTPI